MLRAVPIIVGVLIALHGLIHLLGLVAYWPLATLKELPYRSTLWGIEVGGPGMRIYSLLWLAAALGFLLGAVGVMARQPWWYPVLWSALLLSLSVITLDLGPAWRGALLNIFILAGMLLAMGLRGEATPYAPFPQQGQALQQLPLPQGLPAPVERFYRTAFGDSIPQMESVVLTGTATMRVGGITFPSRWRFAHQMGQAYRHEMEGLLYGQPLLRVHEQFLSGRIRMALPFGVVENEPKSDMAANLSLWGEGLLFPSIFLTDPRVRWEGLDQTHARLVVPFGAEEDQFMVTFDPGTGLLRSMEALRWKEPTSNEKTLWRLEPLAWGEVAGAILPTEFAVTWADETGPWLRGRVTESRFNVDVDAYIKAELGTMPG